MDRRQPGHLEPHAPIASHLTGLGVSGYPFVGVDVGGFSGSPTPELLTRWTALGTFLPIDRNHAAKGTRDREPWVDGPEHEAIRKKFIEERYRLLPYIYTSMEETSRTGVPLMRPMFLDFPDDPRMTLREAEEQYMFGNDLLVAPKVKDFVDGYDMLLPKGTWYDYWTGKPVAQSERSGQTPIRRASSISIPSWTSSPCWCAPELSFHGSRWCRTPARRRTARSS